MAARRGEAGSGKNVTIVLRREEVVEGGHHGGAWKVAYADFVTAMMAFFLLMWLLNATTEEQRKGLADYFSPTNLLAHATSGSGKPFGGKTPYEDGAMVSDRGAAQVTPGNAQPVPDADWQDTATVAQPDRTEDGGSGQEDSFGAGSARRAASPAAAQQTAPQQTAPQQTAPQQTAAQLDAKVAADAAARREQAAFAQAASELQAAVAADPALADLSRQLKVDQTPEGLRIQLLDEEHRPMFATGSAVLDDRVQGVLRKIAPVLLRLSEDIAITGHTDATQYRMADRPGVVTNWELSSARADATRKLLVDAGLPEHRVRSISGDADRDPLVATDPLAAANRRIAIVVLRRVAVSPRVGAGP